MPPNILTIAGSDSGGGAGIQADLKTIMSFGCYGMSAITALTAQNGLGVTGIFAPPASFAALQLAAILDGFTIQAAKTGMLFSVEIIEAISPLLRQRDFPLVVDPVSVSQSGSPLLQKDAVDAMVRLVIPDCDLLTPNTPEARMLTGITVENAQTAQLAGEALLGMGARAVLIKGGHMPKSDLARDYLILPGQPALELAQQNVRTDNNHGTGCTLSAAIACGLGMGQDLVEAIVNAQKYINLALRLSYNPGKGAGPVNHAARLELLA